MHRFLPIGVEFTGDGNNEKHNRKGQKNRGTIDEINDERRIKEGPTFLEMLTNFHNQILKKKKLVHPNSISTENDCNS